MPVVLYACDGSPVLSIRVTTFPDGRPCIETDHHGDGGKGYITAAGAKRVIAALQAAVDEVSA